MRRRRLNALFGLGGAAVAAVSLWLAVDELTRPGGQAWLALLTLATVPVFLGMGYLLPSFIFARDRTERARIITSPLWSVCQAAFMWLVTVAIGALIADWKGALAAAALGAVVALEGIGTMRRLRAVDRARNAGVATRSRPTRGQIARLLVRVIVFWIAVIGLVGGAAYAVLGRDAAIVTACLLVAAIGLTYGVTFYRFANRQHVRSCE